MDVLIVGAGGHGQVIAEALWRCWERDRAMRPLGYLDDDAALLGRKLVDVPVMGPIAALLGHREGVDPGCVADRDAAPAGRPQVDVVGAGAPHRDHRQLAAGGQHAVAEAGVGADVDGHAGAADALDQLGLVVGPAGGDHVHLAPGVHMGGAVTVDEGALVGVGASVLPAGHVGAWSVVGGGACVTEPVAPGATVVGVPAREVSRG